MHNRLDSRTTVCVLILFSALSASAAPQLRLSTNSIGTLFVESGSNAQPQVVNAFNIGDGALNLSVASTSASWLTASIGQPTTCSSGPVTGCIPINISAAVATLPVGTYTESVTVSDPNATDSPQTISVTVQVDGAPTNVDLYVTPNGGTAAIPVNLGGSVISTVKTNDGGSWLNFVLFSGNQVVYTGYQLRVTAQPGQPEGTYSGNVILSGSNFPADDRTINVNMHVTSQPIVQIPTTPITFNLFQGQAPLTYNVAFQNIGQGALAINGATVNTGSGPGWLSALPSRNTSVVPITADPGQLSPGSYTGTILLLSNAANASVPIPVRLNVAPAGNPLIAFGGVVDNAAFTSGQAVASGSIAAIFGSQLSSSGPAYASGFPLPTSLGGVQVLINGTPAPLFYADAGQVDVQIPYTFTAGQVTVQVVRNGQAGNRVSTTIDSTAPRIFPLRQLPAAPDGTPFGLVLNSDNTLALPQSAGMGAHPAPRGSILTIYALGLGPVSPAVNTGDPAPSVEPLARIVNQVQVVFGAGTGAAVSVTPNYAGLAPTYAGLYQINVLIPVNAPSGNVAVAITLPGHMSNIVDIAVAP